MNTATQVTLGIAGFFALLALLVFLRLVLRRGPPDWVEYRIGIFVERKPEKGLRPPTTYQPSEWTSPISPPSSQE